MKKPRVLTVVLTDRAYSALTEYAKVTEKDPEELGGVIIENAMLHFAAGRVAGIDRAKAMIGNLMPDKTQ